MIDVPFRGEIVHLDVPMDAAKLTYAVRYIIETAGAHDRARLGHEGGGYAVGIARKVAAAAAGGDATWRARVAGDDERRAKWRLMPRQRPLVTVDNACDAVAFAQLRTLPEGTRVSDFRDLVPKRQRVANRDLLAAVLGHPVCVHPSAQCGLCEAMRRGGWGVVLEKTETHTCVIEDLVVQLALAGMLPNPLDQVMPPEHDPNEWEPYGGWVFRARGE